ncbi:MAG: hypothetical protein JO324_05930, partial [Candidatus Eremiobacteraeota bacterium]|nr:hypothetical protein [Candidatus Eremiobacteraeota bacterium]
MTRRWIAAITALFALSACARSGGFIAGSRAASTSVERAPAAGKVQHVIIIVQENRSFNNLFFGFRGATTAKYGYDERGRRIKLQPVGLETTWDISHDSSDFFAACNGTGSIPGTNCRMNGFG